MRGDYESELQVMIEEEQRADTARYRRAIRTANMIMAVMNKWLPSHREAMRIIEQELVEMAFAHNAEIINVPPECDEMDKLTLERHRYDRSMQAMNAPAEIERLTKECQELREKLQFYESEPAQGRP